MRDSDHCLKWYNTHNSATGSEQKVEGDPFPCSSAAYRADLRLCVCTHSFAHLIRSSAEDMVGLWRSIRVLCWKNWRVKQRESLLNRRRIGRRNQWLFPALLLEMVLPLVVLLLVTRAFCAWNAAIGMGPSQDLRTLSSSTHRLENNPQQRPLHSLLRSLVGGKLSSAQQWHPSIGSRPAEAEMSSDRTQSSLFMTALPLLLSATNQSLAVLNRSESLAFLAFLDRYVWAVGWRLKMKCGASILMRP